MANPNDTTNFIDEFITNIKTVLDNYKSYIGYKLIEITDDSFLPLYPSITLELDSFSEDWKAMPRQKTIAAIFSITYYYQQLSNKGVRTEIRNGLNKISNVFRENWDLNNYCPQLGCQVTSATPYLIAKGDQIIAGGVVTLEARKVITVTLV